MVVARLLFIECSLLVVVRKLESLADIVVSDILVAIIYIYTYII